MNYMKIQMDLIRKLDGENTGVHAGILKDGDIALSLDGYALYKLPRAKFYIDFNMIPNNQLNVAKILEFESISAVKTNNLMKSDKKTVIKIESSEGHAWVDEKLLKYFDKDCTFAISDKHPSRGPIKVFEKEEYAGIVLPVRIDG